MVDLTGDSFAVARRARDLARRLRRCSRPTLLHVVEYVPVEPLTDSLLPAVQMESELLERARAKMAELAARARPAGAALACRSRATSRTRSCASRARAAHDLIVIGSHERHGLSILVNLTEDTVLHGAPCDVLAVRLAGARPRCMTPRIRVSVETSYLPEQSDPGSERYVFSYTITIHNEGARRPSCCAGTGSSPTPTARCRKCAATAWSASSRI